MSEKQKTLDERISEWQSLEDTQQCCSWLEENNNRYEFINDLIERIKQLGLILDKEMLAKIKFLRSIAEENNLSLEKLTQILGKSGVVK